MTEEWSVQTKLSGEFYITDERRSSNVPIVEGLRELKISPEFKDGKWTGLHELEAVLSFEKKDTKPFAPNYVYERAIFLVESIAALATLGIGRPVRISGGVSIKCRLPKIPQSTVSSHVPHRLLVLHLLHHSRRIINYVYRSTYKAYNSMVVRLTTSDAVDRLVSLNNALDLLAGMVNGIPGRVRRCKACGTGRVNWSRFTRAGCLFFNRRIRV